MRDSQRTTTSLSTTRLAEATPPGEEQPWRCAADRPGRCRVRSGAAPCYLPGWAGRAARQSGWAWPTATPGPRFATCHPTRPIYWPASWLTRWSRPPTGWPPDGKDLDHDYRQ